MIQWNIYLSNVKGHVTLFEGGTCPYLFLWGGQHAPFRPEHDPNPEQHAPLWSEHEPNPEQHAPNSEHTPTPSTMNPY